MHTEYGWFGGLRASEDLGNWIIWSCYACTAQEQLTIFCNENIRQAKGNLGFVLLNLYWVGLLEYIVFQDDDWRRFLFFSFVRIFVLKIVASQFASMSMASSVYFAYCFISEVDNFFVAREFQNNVKCTV